MASVEIHGNTPGQISDVAAEVFVEHGYILASKRRAPLIFEKPASKLSNFAYGSWIGDTPVWNRVRLAIVPAGEMTYRVECRAYNVQDKGSAAEEELKIGRLHRGRYQKLLDELAARFKRTADNGLQKTR